MLGVWVELYVWKRIGEGKGGVGGLSSAETMNGTGGGVTCQRMILSVSEWLQAISI